MSETKTSWVNVTPQEVEKKIVTLAKEGMSPERIGLVLRDQHGIPRAKLLGVRIKKILEKEKMWQDPNHVNTKKKIETLQAHITKNKHDYSAKTSLIKQTAKLRIIEKS